MEYKAHFLTNVLVEIVWTFVTLFVFEAIFTQTTSLGGWSKGEVIFLYGFYRLVSAFYYIFFRSNIDRLSYLVNSGEFDLFLTKPISILFHSTTRVTALQNFSQVILGVIILVVYGSQLAISLTPIFLVMLLLMIVSAILMRLSLGVIIMLPVFKLQKLENIAQLQYTFFSSMAKYPRSAFPMLFQGFFSIVIPVLFVAAIPIEVLLGKSTILMAGVVLLMALFWFMLMRYLFGITIRQYTSASS
jgi:ABC-2 type transport system permease protein